MAYRVILTDKAEADVEAMLQWFLDQKVAQAGQNWFGQLIAKLDTLESHPERCPLAAESDDLGEEIRELLLGRRHHKYRILFKISAKTKLRYPSLGASDVFPRVVGVRHLEDFVLEISFSDRTVANLDFRTRILDRGGVFTALQDVAFFAQVAVDREAGTLVWPNGVDFCPDVLFAEATGKAIGELGNSIEVG